MRWSSGWSRTTGDRLETLIRSPVTDLRTETTAVVGIPAQLQWLIPLVPRLSERHHLPAGVIWQLAEDIDAQFAGARVQAFVKLLIEKQLRETLRARDRAARGQR